MSSPTLTVTFVRHGQSLDNQTRGLWAGWKDAPLSKHGMNQARAAGESLSSIPFTVIYASPLLRALATAQAIHDAQPAPKPPLTTSPLLREQHWGVAEGEPFAAAPDPALGLDEHIARGVYPLLREPWQRFPGGESLEDVGARAQQAVEELVMPHVWDAARQGRKDVHVAVVSHGIAISELVRVLVLKDESFGEHPAHRWKRMLNTAWTRVTVDVKGSKEGEPMNFADDSLPPLEIKVTDFNRSEHFDNLKH
ncbi:phosphoglycerate mutase-like protein [Phanerochaete sordida]|uniref:Phosphoglycerate mutase-like protein n=1 Tax=Phanerochaete sordida TaxID=48140 RepID=A0A9P3LKD0_9APHY|nr:phosphoglycerate mutase-like protein [Phanerochaete sordida]